MFIVDGEKEPRLITKWTHEGMLYLCELLRNMGLRQSGEIKPIKK